MRHRKKTSKLSRTSSHRKAMVRNLVCSLIAHEKVKTSKAKAKAARGLADKVVQLAVTGSDTARRRRVFQLLDNKEATKQLFDEVASRFSKNNGGYTRIVACGNNLGDNSEQVFFAFAYDAAEKEKSKSTMRYHFKKKATKKGKKKQTAAEAPAEAAVEGADAAQEGSEGDSGAADDAATAEDQPEEPAEETPAEDQDPSKTDE